MSLSYVSKFCRINVRTIVAVCTVIFLMAGCTTTRVTLKDGTKHEVETVGVQRLPVRFESDKIKVLDLGITAGASSGKMGTPTIERNLRAELIARGQFAVTVTSPLDGSASATLEANGPGTIELVFFPRANYPLIWDGIDQPGVHYYPFHFLFEEKQSKTRFEFTQWSQMDYRTWKEVENWLRKQEMKR